MISPLLSHRNERGNAAGRSMEGTLGYKNKRGDEIETFMALCVSDMILLCHYPNRTLSANNSCQQ